MCRVRGLQDGDAQVGFPRQLAEELPTARCRGCERNSPPGIVRQNPIVAADFMSHAEMGTARNANPCLRVGLSVFRTREQALHRWRLSQYLGSSIAAGELAAEHGKLKLTSKESGHITWWPYANVDRAALFTAVCKCQ
ncbi:MAG: hypothetical protein V2A73_03755 [Pseudomonadota bacterium]